MQDPEKHPFLVDPASVKYHHHFLHTRRIVRGLVWTEGLAFCEILVLKLTTETKISQYLCICTFSLKDVPNMHLLRLIGYFFISTNTTRSVGEGSRPQRHTLEKCNHGWTRLTWPSTANNWLPETAHFVLWLSYGIDNFIMYCLCI